MESKVRIILVGGGFMGSMHAQSYRQIPGAEIVAVACHGGEQTKAKMKSIGWDVPVYPSLTEALAAVSADVVDVCTPTDTHAALAIEAMKAGKSVFCEKPVCLTLEQAKAMLAAQKETGALVQVGHCIRFWPEYVKFKAIVEEGSLGKLCSLSLQRRGGRPGYSSGDWLNKEERSGGAALDLHIHDTDFVLSLLGTPRSVRSQATLDYSGPSHIFTQYDYEGLAVTAEGGWNYPADWGFVMSLQGVFTEGAVEFAVGDENYFHLTRQGGKKEKVELQDANASGSSSTGEGNISSLGAYHAELVYFVDRVRKKQAPAIATLEQAVESARVTLAEIESAKTGKCVDLK